MPAGVVGQGAVTAAAAITLTLRLNAAEMPKRMKPVARGRLRRRLSVAWQSDV